MKIYGRLDVGYSYVSPSLNHQHQVNKVGLMPPLSPPQGNENPLPTAQEAGLVQKRSGRGRED